MSEPCLELVVFKIKDPEKARAARRMAQDVVKKYDGFISWSAYEAHDEQNLFADVVMWRDLEAAKAAAEQVVKEPGFAAIMAEMDGLVSMAHFRLDRMIEALSEAA